MSLIAGERLDKYYGAHDVFLGATCRVESRDRIGLVGPNGEGKTTLLRILAGREEATSGTLTFKRGLRIGYLPQEPPSSSDLTLWDSMASAFSSVRRMEGELHALAERLAAEPDDEALLGTYSALQAEFEHLDGYSYENRIQTVLTGLGFEPAQYELSLAQLSGGQRTRALLGRLLLEEPDVLLLDEPTNHLDMEATEWLEAWLQVFAGALVVVSHDRYLLDRVTQRTWEMAGRRLEIYRGSYGAYVRQREERYKERLRQWEEQQEYIARTEEFIRRHIAGQRTREAQGRRTRLERFLRDEAIERPVEPRHIRVRLDSHGRSGDIVLQIEHLVAGYREDQPLFGPFSIEVRRGARIAVVGPNGAGKTTLMRTLLGELRPLSGCVRHGAQVHIGYLSQTHEYLDSRSTVLDSLLQVRPGLGAPRARTLLGSFLFSGDDVFKRIDQLSGGQRSRVALARLVAQEANLLVLDEPTNHLDIASQEILQEVLQGYGGTLVLVSHDRYLIQGLATHVWVVGRGRVEVVEGGWDAYLAWRAQASEEGTEESPASAQRRSAREEREQQKQARRQRKELEKLEARRNQLEADIEAAEQRLEELSARIGAAGEARDMDQVHELGRAYRDTELELEALWEEWASVAGEAEAVP